MFSYTVFSAAISELEDSQNKIYLNSVFGAFRVDMGKAH